FCFPMHPFPVKKSETAWFAAQANVLCDGAIGYQIDFLIDGAVSASLRVLRRLRMEWGAVKPDLARVLGVIARQYVDPSYHAGSVLADESMHLSTPDFKAGCGKRWNPVETLFYAAHDEQRRDRCLGSLHWRLTLVLPSTG